MGMHLQCVSQSVSTEANSTVGLAVCDLDAPHPIMYSLMDVKNGALYLPTGGSAGGGSCYNCGVDGYFATGRPTSNISFYYSR
ncbi:hypothetical protein Hanom_Chr09g00837841 [Helianthus anomalus]